MQASPTPSRIPVLNTAAKSAPNRKSSPRGDAELKGRRFTDPGRGRDTIERADRIETPAMSKTIPSLVGDISAYGGAERRTNLLHHCIRRQVRSSVASVCYNPGQGCDKS